MLYLTFDMPRLLFFLTALSTAVVCEDIYACSLLSKEASGHKMCKSFFSSITSNSCSTGSSSRSSLMDSSALYILNTLDLDYCSIGP